MANKWESIWPNLNQYVILGLLKSFRHIKSQVFRCRPRTPGRMSKQRSWEMLGVVYTALPKLHLSHHEHSSGSRRAVLHFTRANKPPCSLQHWRAQHWHIRAIFALNCLQLKRLHSLWTRGAPGTTQPQSLIQLAPLCSPGLHSHLSSSILASQNAQSNGCTSEVATLSNHTGLSENSPLCGAQGRFVRRYEQVWGHRSLKVLEEAGTRLQMQSRPQGNPGTSV